jgi:hypothetical protein
MLMEQLNYNLLFRWFVALNMDDPLGRDLLPPALHRARIEPDHSNVILNGGILCLGRRTLSLAPSTENVALPDVETLQPAVALTGTGPVV